MKLSKKGQIAAIFLLTLFLAYLLYSGLLIRPINGSWTKPEKSFITDQDATSQL
jgi:hypothetical protein